MIHHSPLRRRTRYALGMVAIFCFTGLTLVGADTGNCPGAPYECYDNQVLDTQVWCEESSTRICSVSGISFTRRKQVVERYCINSENPDDIQACTACKPVLSTSCCSDPTPEPLCPTCQ